MSEALLLSVIHKLDIDYGKDEIDEEMKSVTKEMREIVDIVRDKKSEEGRTLNFFVCDLVQMAEAALYFFKIYKTDKAWAPFHSIHSWIGEIKKRMLKFGDNGAEMEMESNIRSSENVDVVGLEKEAEMLVRTRIIGGEDELKTILIKGMCGSGKTTLAREIYNRATVVERLERRAWVSNSTHFTLKELLIKLIQQVEDPQNLHTSSLLEDLDNRTLLDMLSQHLQGTRYLIVIDDVPKEMHLLSFLKGLPREDYGSRLLFTSHITHRDISVGIRDVHRMKSLDSKQSWQLFLKTINHGNRLTSEHEFPMDLEHMAKEMLRKCDGLPLAIKEVGKQLVEKKLSGGSEWEQLLESVDFGSTLKLLEIFYHKLDPKLEPCFLSMAFFKKSTTLRAEKLTHIWNVAGAVDYEDNCESYLYGLTNESVIEVKEKSTEYRMNAVLHMLSIQKAEEKLAFEILRNNGNNQPSQSPCHHRVIICSRDKFNYSTDQDKHLVSLFFHGGGYFDTTPSYWKSFEQLNILDLEDFGLKNLPESIGTLITLRYLGLRNNYIKELPQSLGCLKDLEVLDIAQNFMVEVPDIIWEMDSLVHIYMSDVICLKPLKIDALQFLDTLTYISVDHWTYKLSGLNVQCKQALRHIEKLGIEGLDGNSNVSKLFVSLADLNYLKHVALRGYRFRSMPCLDELIVLQHVCTLKLNELLPRLPNNLPPNIESLTLVNSCLDDDPMPLLGNLEKLKYLKLRNAYTGQQMVILHSDFPSLEVLCIKELWNLRNVEFGQGAMYALKNFEIIDCPYMDTLPEKIVWFSYMEEIKMVTTKSIAAKMRNSDLISKTGIVNINP